MGKSRPRPLVCDVSIVSNILSTRPQFRCKYCPIFPSVSQNLIAALWRTRATYRRSRQLYHVFRNHRLACQFLVCRCLTLNQLQNSRSQCNNFHFQRQSGYNRLYFHVSTFIVAHYFKIKPPLRNAVTFTFAVQVE